jgi:hypothetical protein
MRLRNKAHNFQFEKLTIRYCKVRLKLKLKMMMLMRICLVLLLLIISLLWLNDDGDVVVLVLIEPKVIYKPRIFLCSLVDGKLLVLVR